jgi:hypothetical protein
VHPQTASTSGMHTDVENRARWGVSVITCRSLSVLSNGSVPR